MGHRLGRLRAIVGLAGAQLWYYRRRTLLAVAGVALAVLLITLLAGVGHGATTKGMAAFNHTNRDVWMTGGARFAPGLVGGVDNQLLDAHEVARRIESRPDVKGAEAMAFQTVYAGTNGSAFVTLVGVGVTGTSAPLPEMRGEGFTRGDVHYADGTYDGPTTGEVIVDERTAASLDVGVGDTLYVGGTVAGARDTRFAVVGVSSTISSFIGAPTVILHLSELQELAGTTGTDAASLVAITLEPGTDPRAAAADLEREYPGYAVRTSREQFGTVLERQVPVIASVAVIVGLAAVVGAVLVANVLALLVHHQRAELAAVLAAGVSTRTLVGTALAQGLAVGSVGGAAALVATPVAAAALNRAVAALTGFDGLVRTTYPILALGAGVALAMGVLGASVAGWRLARLGPLEHLR